MVFNKSDIHKVNSRLFKHVEDLAKAGLNVTSFDKKRILALEELDVLLIQDINLLHSSNVLHYDKILPYLQTLRKDLEKILKNPSEFTSSEEKHIKELLNGIIAFIKKTKPDDSNIFNDRMHIIKELGFDIKKYPELANFLCIHWNETDYIIKLTDTDARSVFTEGLIAIKDVINDKTYPYLAKLAGLRRTQTSKIFEFSLPKILDLVNEKTLPYLVEISESASSNTDYVFSYGIPAIRSIFTEKNLPYLVEMAKATGIDTGRVFYISLPKLIDILNDETFPYFVEIAKLAKKSTEYVFEGMTVIKPILNKKNLALIVELIDASQESTRILFERAIPPLKEHITDETLPYFVEISKITKVSTGSTFLKWYPDITTLLNKKYLPYIVKLAKALENTDESTIYSVLSDGLSKINKLLNEDTFPYIIEIAKISKKDADYVFEHTFPQIHHLLNKKYLPYILELIKIIKEELKDNTGVIFTDTVPHFAKVMNEWNAPHLIKLAKSSGKHVHAVLDYGFKTVEPILDKDNIEKVFDNIIKMIPYFKGAETQNFIAFYGLDTLVFMFGERIFELLIFPTIKNQTVASFLCFGQFRIIHNTMNTNSRVIETEKDLEILRYIVTKKSRRANDILSNLIIKGLQKHIIEYPLSKDTEILKAFLDNSPANLIELYAEFKKIYLGTKTDKNIHYTNLFKNVVELKKDIIEGRLTKNYTKDLLIGVLFSVFTPEVTVDRTQYERFLKLRQDRDFDIPESIKKYSGIKVRISEGGFIQKEEVNIESWNNLIEAVSEINKQKIDIEPSKLGLNLLIEYNKNNLRNKQKEYLKYIYSYNVALGNTMPEFSATHEVLMKYKEFIGDRLRNDLIFSLLSKAQEKYSKEFQELASGQKDFKQLAKTLLQIWQSNIKDKESKILEILKSKGFNIKEIKWNKNITASEINAELTNNTSGVISKELVQNIFNQLYGEQYEHMQKEMTKFEFKKEGKGLFGKPFRFVLSKKKMHSVAMFNMGVCVAVDEKLWNEKDMWQMIIFDEEDNACGGVIYRTIEEDNKKYLVLSIQPSSTILGSVSPMQLYNKIIQFSKTITHKLGYTNVVIPISAAIHSNRGSIQEIITSKNYPKIKLKKEYQFSYEPYKYSYNEFYIVT